MNDSVEFLTDLQIQRQSFLELYLKLSAKVWSPKYQLTSVQLMIKCGPKIFHVLYPIIFNDSEHICNFHAFPEQKLFAHYPSSMTATTVTEKKSFIDMVVWRNKFDGKVYIGGSPMVLFPIHSDNADASRLHTV